MKMFGVAVMAFWAGVITYYYWPAKIYLVCFDYQLNIDQDISEDTKKAITDSLKEASSKIVEACNLVMGK